MGDRKTVGPIAVGRAVVSQGQDGLMAAVRVAAARAAAVPEPGGQEAAAQVPASREQHRRTAGVLPGRGAQGTVVLMALDREPTVRGSEAPGAALAPWFSFDLSLAA